MLRMIQTGFARRIPVILQNEVAECGLACLAMVLNAYGHQTDLGTLRRQAGISASGINLRSLMRIAERFELTPRPLKLDMDGLVSLTTPCILHWNFNHFVVLTHASAKYYRIHDPAHGALKLNREEVSRHFTGVALELTPTTKFEKRDDRRALNIRDMFRNVRHLSSALVILGAFSLGLEFISLLNPMLSQVLIDEVLTTGDHALLWTIAAALALLLILQGVISTFRAWSVMLLSTRISVQWNVSLFTHLMELPQDFFAKRGAGDILSRFGSLGTIQQTFTTDLVQSIMDGIMAIGMFIMIIVYGKWLAVIVAISSALDLGVRLVLFQPYREGTEEALVHTAAQQGHFLETLRGIRSIKLLGIEEGRRIAWTNRLIDSVNAGLRLKRFDIVFARANDAIFGIDRLLMLTLGARMVLNGQMSVGMLVAFLSYRDQMSTRLGTLISAGFKIKNLKVECDRLSDIALTEAEQVLDEPVSFRSSSSRPNDPTVPALECRNIGYRYGREDAWVFRNISFSVPVGRNFVITGPSGCGKSTLLAIMMGLIQPEEGKFLWNGVELGPHNREAFRAQIGGVLQDDILLSGSLAENIASFDTDIDLEKVTQCAQAAQLLEDITKMPMGFETLVSEMGSTLSGGQRQRLILARALYRKPQILFLDEATSNLDIEREQKITTLLNQLAITRVLVAHRPDVIASADFKFDMSLSPVRSN